MSLSLTARWIFPVASPPLPGGIVVIDGERIVAVEPHGTRTADLDLGNVAIIPGLVNAHTHLDLTSMHGIAPPRLPLPDWLSDVIEYRRTTTPEETLASIRVGLEECIRTGTTLVGDISGGGISWPILASSGIRATVYYEVIGMSEERANQVLHAFAEWEMDRQVESVPCLAGCSPHAPYSVASTLYTDLDTFPIPIATHLAESEEELELLADRSGPFVDFLQRLGVWLPDRMANSPADVFWCLYGDSTSPVSLVHGNYLSPENFPDDTELPSHFGLVYCPRTHAAFGHAPHPWREFMARGVRVALGTDSLASNPDLDLLAEARFLRVRHPDVSGATLLRMATLSGAEALDWDHTTGSLEAGKSADLVVIPLDGRQEDDPHDLFLASDEPVAKVMCRGRWLEGGNRQDEG